MTERFEHNEQLKKNKVMFIPGFGANIGRVFKKFSQAMEAKGRPVTFLNHGKRISKKIIPERFNTVRERALSLARERIDEGKIAQLEKLLASIPLSFFYEIESFIKQIESASYQDEPLDFVAHSQGALMIAFVALLRPDLVERGTIILNNPIGFNLESNEQGKSALEKSEKLRNARVEEAQRVYPKVTVGSILRTGRLVINFIFKPEKAGFKGSLSPVLHAFKNLFNFQLLREAHTLANTDIVPILAFLQESYGVDILVRYGTEDKLINAEQVEKRAGEAGIRAIAVPAGHTEMILEPESAAEKMDALLSEEEEN